MWNNLTYELGLKVYNKEIDDLDLALELMPKDCKNKSKEFAKLLSLDVMPEFDLENYQVPQYFMFKRVPKDLTKIKYDRIINLKSYLLDNKTIDVFNMAGNIVALTLNVDIEKVKQRKFIDIVGLSVFFLRHLKKL
jgi:hypothetical protein